jgi:hypothetical protein
MVTKFIIAFLFFSFSLNTYAQNDTLQSNDSIQILEWKSPVKKYAPSIKKEEKEALTEFVKFCKTQFEIDNLYKDNQHYSVIILNALGYDTGAINVTKNEVLKKLDEVLKNEEVRKSFLSFFAKIGNNDYNLIYFSIKPATNSYYRSKIELSAKNADILTSYIINHYYYISETPKQAESDSKKQDSIKYIAIEKKAVFKGGEQNYIYHKLIYPEIENLDTRISEFIVNASVQILEDGSIGNFSFKSDIRFKSEYTFDSELKSELINKYSQYFEDAVAGVLVIMPKWIPAKSEEQNIKSRVNIPVKFKISE